MLAFQPMKYRQQATVLLDLLTLETSLTLQRSRQRTLENPEYLPLQLPFKTGLRIPLPLGMLTKT
jgi:hypothetical protein